MGFIKRLLGLETNPGEPKALRDESFDAETAGPDPPCIVYFYNLWCSTCQVMGGLLNEIGPDYRERVKLFKMNTDKEPNAPARFGVYSVPTLIVLRDGREVDRLVGLVPIDILRNWIEKNLAV